VTTTVHQMKITLKDISPPIWRRIEVPSDITLGELSGVLEAAMGWYGGHLHGFDANGTRYGVPDPDWPSDDLDENKYRLGAVLPKVGSKMRFDYDFGDGWEHAVLVEAINPVEADTLYPRCVKGKRACPPEDCGGSWGYMDILATLNDPDYKPEAVDRDEMMEWLPLDFDPEHFDITETDVDMRTPRPSFDW
jgi:hypothetical protein